MKRSEINQLMREAVSFIHGMGFRLPPFVLWSEAEWREKGAEYDEIRSHMLGWDITDFGGGDFSRQGLLLITLRNGSLADAQNAKPYAEKLMIVSDGQVTPWHFHWSKTEDIINRGGGKLVMKLANSDKSEEMLSTPVTVHRDGRAYAVAAGERIVLLPGESVTMQRGQYHTFWAEGGKCLVGEVSAVNDDRVDNRFYEPVGRFPAIEEDEAKLYPLFSEYPTRA